MKPESLSYWIAQTPLGRMLLAKSFRGLRLAAFGDTDEALKNWMKSRLPFTDPVEDHAVFVQFYPMIKDYFSGQRRELNVLLDPHGTEFQQAVWQQLLAIPYGETWTYQQLADSLKKSKAVRAVAKACGDNPIALFIPCHRVVGSNGDLSGYRWGLERKRQLLAMEQNQTARVALELD
jgi:O-6-methylguanine DNA methyltransferase